MKLYAPAPLASAIAALKKKALMPANLSSYDFDRISQAAPQLLDQSLFSARTTDLSYLSKMADGLMDLVDPDSARAAGRLPSKAEFRLAMRDALKSIGYDAGTAGVPRGSIKDLASDSRLNLIAEMQTDFQYGKGGWESDQDPILLELWPAQELFRLEEREKKRDWISRWTEAGGELFDGRMIALKNDPIWIAISRFGLPYPPFDYGSGMWVRDIAADEAIALGVMAQNDAAPKPMTSPYPASQFDASTLQPALLQAFLEEHGDEFAVEDGILTRRAA